MRRRMTAMLCWARPGRTRLSSSRKAISNTRWTESSMPQCPRVVARSCLALGGRLEMNERVFREVWSGRRRVPSHHDQAMELGPSLIVVYVVQAIGVGDETTLFLFACIHMRIHLQEFVRILPLFCGDSVSNSGTPPRMLVSKRRSCPRLQCVWRQSRTRLRQTPGTR